MNDPFSRLTVPVVLFLIGLLVFMGLVYFADRAHASFYVYEQNGGTNLAVYGNRTGGAGIVYTAFEYTPDHTFTADVVSIEIVRSGTPTSTGNTTVVLREGGTDPDNGTYVASAIQQNTFETGANCNDDNFVDFNFGLPVQFTSGTKYFFRVENSVNEGITPSRNLCSDNVAPDWQYATSWINGAGNDSFRIGTSQSTGNESITWEFPQQGIITPDFSYWVLNVTGTNPAFTYYLNVNAFLSTSTVSTTEQGTTFTDISTFSNASSSSCFRIKKSDSLTPGQDGDRTWTVTAKICGEPYCFIPFSSSTVVLTTNFSSTIPDLICTDDAKPFHNADDYLYSGSGEKLTREQVTKWSTTGWCDPPATSTSWWGEYFSADHLSFGMCRVMEVLLKPDEKDYSAIGDAFDNIKKIYPFKYAWDIVDTAKDNAILPDTTLSPTLTLDMRTAFANDTASVTLLSSSTLSGFVGSTQAENIKTTERYVVWSVVFGLIIKALLI